MSESPKPADALRTLPERAFRARARLVAGVFCLVCCGLAIFLILILEFLCKGKSYDKFVLFVQLSARTVQIYFQRYLINKEFWIFCLKSLCIIRLNIPS